jgi:hypothetical protein
MAGQSQICSASLRRVNMADDDEANYWMKKFGVSRAELTAAVNQVGEDLEALRRLFSKECRAA